MNQSLQSKKKTKTFPKNQDPEKRTINLSHSYSDKKINWVTAQEFNLDTVFKGRTK